MGTILRKLLIASAVAAALVGSAAWAAPKTNPGWGKCKMPLCPCEEFSATYSDHTMCSCGHYFVVHGPGVPGPLPPY